MKKISCLVAWIVLAGTCFGAAGGSSGLEFLKIGAGARPAALGEAFTGVSNDISALSYNPAGLGQIVFPEVMTMYNNMYADMTHMVAGAAYPVNYGVIGVHYSALNSGDIQGYDATGAMTSLYNTSSTALGLSFGRKINPNTFVGAGLKSISDRLESTTASGMSYDLGILYLINPSVSLGFSAMNLGSGITYVSEETPLPTSYRLGAGYAGKLFNEDLNVMADLTSLPDGSGMNFGIEYVVRNLIALRAGSMNGALRAGLGLYTNLFALDYAYLGHQDLGAAHQVSMNFVFGAPERSRKAVLENMARGKAYLKEQRFADAVMSFEKAVALDPKNDEAQTLLKKSQLDLEQQMFEMVFAKKRGEVERDSAEIIASGRTFLSQGKFLEALAEFSKVLEKDPGNREALRLQSEAQSRMESQLIQRGRDEANVHLGEAMKLIMTKQYREALPEVDRALERDPKNRQAIELKKKLELILRLEEKQ